MKQDLYPALILDALRTVRYPGTGKNIVENGMLADDIRIDGQKVSFTIVFDRATDPFLKSVVKAAETAVKTFASEDAEVSVATEVRQAAPAPKPKALPQVKNIIGISSGKGGV
ncbi:MAG: iron-sulfur cluster assembly protein, partial [Muribaculaceae bacterium]|nr:iron-sulfur cluster assembly protein [Muribaculaceae bacterium]